MPESIKFIPTKVIEIKREADGSEVMTFECGTPYQDGKWTIPSGELAKRGLRAGWSIPKITCNQFDPETGKCKMWNYLISLSSDPNLQKPVLADCRWAKNAL